MDKRTADKSNIRRGLLRFGLPALAILIVLGVAITARAWFYSGKSVVAISEISNPTIISINSGNMEDVRYINLGRIDVSAPDSPNEHYKDFVFCINGINIQYYKLQLAYTTNNQFEYEVYEADLWDGTGIRPNTSVLYTVNVSDGNVSAGTEQYYYMRYSTKIAGSLVNEDETVMAESIALNSGYYHDSTYRVGETDVYTNRNKYAIPLYWQSSSSLEGSSGQFCNYYILRVIWPENATNTKETDIIYIAAKNTAELPQTP